MKANYHRDIGVSSVVEYVGLERTYFSTLFRRVAGRSLQEFLISCRMQRARELLRDSGYSVANIASSVGYDSYFTFARRFRETTGMTASQYREQSRG